MLQLIKLFLCFCISAILSGCPFLATLFGYTALTGYEMYNSPETVQPIISVEREMGFATLVGQYDLHKADNNDGLRLSTDEFCITYGTYAGYMGEDGNFVPEVSLSVQGAETTSERTYQSTWGTLHAGSLLGGTTTTDYKGYFVDEVVGLNPANFVKQSDGQAQDGTVYEYYSYKDAAMGLDYMLKLFYSNDRSGAVYLFGVRDYTVSNAPLLDDFAFSNFTDKSFALSDVIASYDGNGSGSTSLFNVELYEGEWDSGYVSIDGEIYNLHATNLRALEDAGVVPFDDAYIELGYDTPTKSGGKKDIAFLFGRRVIYLKLEFSSVADATLRDAKVYGFSTEITNNSVTDSELVHGSYGIHPTGQTVSEQDFIDTYYGGAPYSICSGGMTHYYTHSGVEITWDEYNAILKGETITKDTTSTTTDDTSVSDNEADTDEETTDETTDEETTDETTDETTTEGEGSASENSASENSASENSVSSSDGGNGFADVNTGGNNTDPEQDITIGDWFVIGGLHTDVTLASLEVYLSQYSTGYTTKGSGNAITYTVTRGSAKMIFVLEKSTTISTMEVFYENG